jgi:hypothetical protein
VSLSEAVSDLVSRQGETEGKRWLLDVLTILDELGCEAFVPPAQDLRYINVRPAPGAGHHRLCSVHVRTASVEFQANTYPLATSLGLPGYRLVPKGEKAAITPRCDDDLRQVRALAVAELARRRGLS